MDFGDSVKTWSDISERDDVRAIYSEGAVDGQTLPWEVRSALGDALCEVGFDEAITSSQKSEFLASIGKQLAEAKNKVAQEQWNLFTGLKIRDGKGILRKHTKKSLYSAVKTCIDKERKLVENEDISQFLDEPESVSQVSEPRYSLKNSDSYEDVSDEMDVDADRESEASKSRQIPECAKELFKQLSKFT